MPKTETISRREALSLQRRLIRALDQAESHLQDASAVIAKIVETEAWIALGYEHSVEWWDREIGVHRMHPAIREVAVAALSQPHPGTGRRLSQREIASRVDAGVGTVNRDLRKVTTAFTSAKPETVTVPADRWSREERSMRAALKRGEAVLANEQDHPHLLMWAQTEDGGPSVVHIDGRGRWSNPFESPADGDPATIVDNYKNHFLPYKPSLLAALADLRGKILVCTCYGGEPCHGEVIIQVLNGNIRVPKARARKA